MMAHGTKLWSGGLLLAGLMVLAGGVRADPGLSLDLQEAEEAVFEPVAESDQENTLEENNPAEGKSNNRKKNNRFVLDPSTVLTLQMQALDEQRNHYEDDRIWGVNRFTKWLDRTHEALYIRLDNAVRRLDTMWLPEGVEYDYKVSTFRISALTRVGGRGLEGDYNVKIRFNMRLALPGLQREWYVFLDNTGRDDLPGADPLKQESDTRIGLRSERDIRKRVRYDLSGGLRLRGSGPVGYLDAGLRRRWTPGEWDVQLMPRIFYYSDEGFGQMASLVLTRPLDERRAIQFRTVERSTEATNGFEFEQTMRFAWYRSGRKRGWVVQASAFPHHKNSTMYWDNALVNITWRDALYKKWIYYTLTPQVDFAREDDYEPRPSLRVGVSILLGGQVPDLM